MLNNLPLIYICDIFPDYIVHFLSMMTKRQKEAIRSRWRKIYLLEPRFGGQYLYPIFYHASLSVLNYYCWHDTKCCFLRHKTWLKLPRNQKELFLLNKYIEKFDSPDEINFMRKSYFNFWQYQIFVVVAEEVLLAIEQNNEKLNQLSVRVNNLVDTTKRITEKLAVISEKLDVLSENIEKIDF